MNETTYNIAMLGKEYLDKAIDGIQALAPKVWWYLQWKCYIDAIISGIIIIVCLTWVYFVRWSLKPFTDEEKDVRNTRCNNRFNYWNNYSDGIYIPLIILGTIAVFGIFFFAIYHLIISLTPICPIDKLISIGKTLM